MRAVSENLVRVSMSSVDIWRAIETLEAQGWNEQAIADALALPVRTVARLKLLANLHPAMLDAMAAGSMPNEDQLRTIARTSRDEQAQVWKKQYADLRAMPTFLWQSAPMAAIAAGGSA
jgi:ParB-like chromosome segregation protein Spo0J